jgi:hypothetical protein
MISDALLPPTIKRMRLKHQVCVMHVPDTGQTPVLSDRNQNWFIHEWLMGRIESNEWTVLHAKPREGESVAPPKERARQKPRLVAA